jgi:carbon monoxide dehydrogenase subunit G
VRVEGRHTFAKERAEIWSALQDPGTLAATLPGVKRLELTGSDRYELSASVGVGSVKGLFEGTFAVEDKRELESCVLRGSARGPSGSASVEARVRLSDADAGSTQLDYSADANVTGPIAGVGQRMIASASKRMARQFFEAVDAYQPQEARPDVASDEGKGAVFQRPSAPASDQKQFVRGVLVGFSLALAGVLVGRWSVSGRR